MSLEPSSRLRCGRSAVIRFVGATLRALWNGILAAVSIFAAWQVIRALAWGVVYSAGRTSHRDLTLAAEPGRFWFTVAFWVMILVIGVVTLVREFRPTMK